MIRLRTIGVALVAILAMSAVAATAAQAAQGPFYRVCEKVGAGKGSFKDMGCKEALAGGEWENVRLVAGKTKTLESAAATNFVLKNGTAKVKIQCTTLKLKAGATINGSTGANAGTSTEVIEYSGCTGGGNLESLTTCKPVGGTVTTESVTNTLGYSSAARTGPIEVLFKPAVGSTFAKIKFEGTDCFVTETTVTGTAVGLAEVAAGAVEVGKNEVFEETGFVNFTIAAKTIWTESAGALTETKAKLTAFGGTSTLEGKASLKLSTKEKWGVFTK